MSRRLAIILAIVAVGAIAVWFFVGRSGSNARPSDETARRVADDFLASLKAKQVDAAWERTTPDFKSFRGKSVFRKYVQAQPMLMSALTFESVKDETKDERRVTNCVYAVPGQSVRVQIAVAFDGGEWRVDGLRVD